MNKLSIELGNVVQQTVDRIDDLTRQNFRSIKSFQCLSAMCDASTFAREANETGCINCFQPVSSPDFRFRNRVIEVAY